MGFIFNQATDYMKVASDLKKSEKICVNDMNEIYKPHKLKQILNRQQHSLPMLADKKVESPLKNLK